MKQPTFSLLVPTHQEGRPLARCLDSVAPQLGPRDEVLVIGDTHDGPLPGVEALVRSYGKRFRYLAHDAGGHDYGHSQLNHGLAQARGAWIHCNDDDDVWCPDALDAFRRAILVQQTPAPFLFRFQSYQGRVFWHRLGRFARHEIGGHCLLTPNVPGKVGRFGPDYSGDFDYLGSTVAHYGGPDGATWEDRIVCVARPS